MAKRRRKTQTKRGAKKRKTTRKQKGEGVVSVVAGLPKAAWSITKALEKRAKKQALKAHEKRAREFDSGKRKTFAGESFTCCVM